MNYRRQLTFDKTTREIKQVLMMFKIFFFFFFSVLSFKNIKPFGEIGQIFLLAHTEIFTRPPNGLGICLSVYLSVQDIFLT